MLRIVPEVSVLSSDSLAEDKFSKGAKSSKAPAVSLDYTEVYSPYSLNQLEKILTVLRSRLLEWELELIEGILRNRDPGESFIAINEWIERDFAVVNMDMQYVFFTEGYAKSRSIQKNGKLPSSLYQDLVSQKKFHKAAAERNAFYYYTDSVDCMDLCRNIFAGDQYIARIVMTLHPEETELPEGAVELFEIYADHIQDMFAHNSVFRENNSRLQMQELCRTLLDNGTADPAVLMAVLDEFSWKQGDEFIAILLKFNTEAGWNAQLYMMLPYLCSVLEAEWTGSYTIQLESEILLIVNTSYQAESSGKIRSEKNKGISQTDRNKGKELLLRKLAYFIRENTCKAGVSPVFTDFTQLRSAMDLADAAYIIGSELKPHHWYFLFDDIRLQYFTRSLKKSLSSSLALHPALRILKEYDELHNSELNRTLHVYLKNSLNMTTAAEELFIHRTSFCRRMNTIKELTAIDLNDPDTVLALLISYRLE